ncbi:hypothetical protein ATK74_1161 [Propionicimonas paludicola]|uniref:Uncharacterized protein n=1 Tax=Propionicimonas paludicola TaxID=185243 RepID=A0A2A9CQA9_9ACTN|nr:hypothetical protein [Propionicimonas paludicola]PFG16614.1 hypothetical protein ATK74_1161 [Propionicimonas paludicola]
MSVVRSQNVPPGWPGRVWPPSAPDWELTAVEFLLDCCPAEFRNHPVLRRQPLVLARFAGWQLDGAIRAGEVDLRTLRAQLSGRVSPEVVGQAAEVWQEATAHLQRRRREVRLVADALGGARFRVRL